MRVRSTCTNSDGTPRGDDAATPNGRHALFRLRVDVQSRDVKCSNPAFHDTNLTVQWLSRIFHSLPLKCTRIRMVLLGKSVR